MPMPIIRKLLSDIDIISCSIPLTFFLFINKSFGFLNTIFFLQYLINIFLTNKQLILVKADKDILIFLSSWKKLTNKFPLYEIHLFPY